MTDEDVGQDPEEARALRALRTAERLAVPAGFAGGVMRAVRERAPADSPQLSGGARVVGDKNPGFWSRDRRRVLSGAGSMSSRKLLLGIAAVAVIAIGYFAIKGYPPVEPGTEATVGAAKRYQSEQIAGKDVLLQDAELQAFMQTDVFHTLSDMRAVTILGSETFRDALATICRCADSSASQDTPPWAISAGDRAAGTARYPTPQTVWRR